MTVMPSTSTLILQTVIAVRNAAGAGWQMVALPCSAEDIAEHIGEMANAGAEKRFVGTGEVAQDRWERSLANKALRRGWHQNAKGGAWFPIEEPLRSLPGSPLYADVKAYLDSIAFGTILIAIEVNGVRHDIGLDDLEDSLELLVRFIQVLASGGQPHAVLADYGCASMIIQDGPEPHLCRLYLANQHPIRNYVIDVMTDRATLLSQFRDLAQSIADHPNFAHHFVCHCCLPDGEYDRVSEAAEAEWARGVREGRFADDPVASDADIDAGDAFVASQLSEKVTLPEDCARLAEQHCAMLRSLEIPQDLLVKNGFASM